jgi:hypothetical protein
MLKRVGYFVTVWLQGIVSGAVPPCPLRTLPYHVHVRYIVVTYPTPSRLEARLSFQRQEVFCSRRDHEHNPTVKSIPRSCFIFLFFSFLRRTETSNYAPPVTKGRGGIYNRPPALPWIHTALFVLSHTDRGQVLGCN